MTNVTIAICASAQGSMSSSRHPITLDTPLNLASPFEPLSSIGRQASVRFMGGTHASNRGFNFIRRLLLEHAQQDVQAEPHHHAGDDEHQDP